MNTKINSNLTKYKSTICRANDNKKIHDKNNKSKII